MNIPLKGEADKVHGTPPVSDTFAIKPTDFHGIRPKLTVKQGDEVLAGSPLFFDKDNPDIVFTSPVSGEIAEIVRGEKRKILDILILADKQNRHVDFPKGNPSNMSREDVIKTLLKSGTWPMIRQRPLDIIANPSDKPKSIFISAFDSNPLAPDMDFVVHGNGDDFQTGLDALAKLTEGRVHLNVRNEQGASKVFLNARNVQVNKVSGPHPAGNVGVQIHHIDPINKGEVVWFVTPQDVLVIGRLFNTGKFDASRMVALAGPGIKKPQYYKTMIGASVKGLINEHATEGNHRIISGNPLTGKKIGKDGYLGFYDAQICVLDEGDHYEFFGWMAPGGNKFSLSRTYPSWLMKSKKYNIDTNLHGEHRAFVMSGQYEKVFPMDIFPVYLIKAIMANDIEKMEELGIYEVAPEDFALCEFVCTSKIDVQDVVRKGLDQIRIENAPAKHH